MKRIFLLISICSTLVFTSCNFTEELHVKEDGTGKISIGFDGSELMQMAGDKMPEGEEKKIDSIISFKQLFKEKKDSIAKLPLKEQEKLKKLEKFTMHMKVDAEAKEMNFSMFSDFKNVNELGDVLGSFQEASAGAMGKGGAQKQPPSMIGNADGTEVSYSFNNNIFSRNTKIVDQELYNKAKDSLNLDQAKSFLEGSTYTLKYHFPRKIKKISAEEALFSQDGKSFTLEVNFLTILEDPTVLNLEVELED